MISSLLIRIKRIFFHFAILLPFLYFLLIIGLILYSLTPFYKCGPGGLFVLCVGWSDLLLYLLIISPLILIHSTLISNSIISLIENLINKQLSYQAISRFDIVFAAIIGMFGLFIAGSILDWLLKRNQLDKRS